MAPFGHRKSTRTAIHGNRRAILCSSSKGLPPTTPHDVLFCSRQHKVMECACVTAEPGGLNVQRLHRKRGKIGQKETINLQIFFLTDVKKASRYREQEALVQSSFL